MKKRNLIVGQSGGPTSVINSSLAGVYINAKERGYDNVYGMLNGVQGFMEKRYIDLSDYLKNDLDIELLKHTPSAFLGCCRYKLPLVDENRELYEKIFNIMDELEIDTFIYIGGNDSMDTISKLSVYARLTGRNQRFIGVPKTIDNDLALTDHCPGFGSAAKYLALSTKEIIRDAWSMAYSRPSVTVMEVMGRNAGWLTGSTALAHSEESEGPDMIFLPEVIFDIDDFTSRVENLFSKKASVVVAVSEGVKTKDGKYVCELGANVDYVDPFGHKQLTGTGVFLTNHLMQELGIKGRSIEFSILQRCASHIASRVDIDEAFMVGGAAVKAADMGETEKMIVIERLSDDPYMSSAVSHDVQDIANEEKVVPREWIDLENAHVTDEFIDYVKPLIHGSFPSIMVNGLPRHLSLDWKNMK